ncbi:entericidin A/B family lipoprotein [Acidisoma cellulosilyticum]|nr:entericidin A/B family lipoprotein [Acidisoma cellulosilyticum]
MKTRTAAIPTPILPRYLLLMALAAAVVLTLAGCNTISGAGQDVSNTGHAVSHAANSVENHL